MKMFLLVLLTTSTAIFAEPVCHKCEIIREYNKAHPGKDEYYEDYLMEEAGTQNKTETEAIDKAVKKEAPANAFKPTLPPSNGANSK